MSEADKDYEMRVLRLVLNTYLEEIVSVTKEGLKFLESDRDQVVWKLATRIYTQSGHKIEFSIIRDVVDAKTEVIKQQLEMESRQIAEEERRQKSLKADFSARVLKIVGEQLGVDRNEVKLDSHLVNDLGMDYLDFIELIEALEEEFEVEIPEGIAEESLRIEYRFNFNLQSLSSSSSSESMDAGADCTVKNLMNLVWTMF